MIIVRDFNIPLLITDRTSQKSISKDIKHLTSNSKASNITINHIELSVIYSKLHPTTTNYKFCLCSQNTPYA